LSNSLVAGSGKLIDHHHFYFDPNNRGRYSCGLARQEITEFLHRHGEERNFLGAEWLKTLQHYKDNFADLDTWLSELEGFNVETSFLWIYEDKQGRETDQVEQQDRIMLASL
jgi:hypothetical protein